MNSKGVDATAAVSTLGKRKFGASTSASVSASSADSVAAGTVYEVFLSFHGKDTRKGFTDYLYNDLVGANIQTFRDNDELKVGQEIGDELLKAIKESKISIPIFSKNYASSKWCLLELEEIVKCHKNWGQKIFPIFYDVVPSNVRNQEESYALAFSLLEKEFDEDTIQRWRDALKVVGKLKGLELEKETNGHEGKLVKLVVEKILMELKKNYTHVPKNLVGMDNHIEELMGLLEVDSDNVRIVGIHGMGGLGKTTITKFIYNEICYKNFDGQCFLDNIREKSKHHDGIVELQKQFISNIQKRGVPSFSDVNRGRSLIGDIVHRKKLLLVLDDVDDYYQVDMLMGESSWYGARSRIILTTRDKGVLNEIELNCESNDSSVCYRNYEPKFMDSSDSLQLFSNHAFKRDFPIEEYNILSMEVVSIAAGFPLVLVVLGSTFFLLRDIGLWEDKLRQLRKIPNKKVLEKLKISFEALDDTEKEIFLDIACHFIHCDKTRPTYMWEDCGLYPKLGISALVSKSLITIDDDDVFQMHDQLRDLGRQIVREEGLHGKQSRIWCSDEAWRVLKINQGTSWVNAIHLEYDNAVVAPHFHHLPNLRYLSTWNIRNVDGDFKDFSNLRWLECLGELDNSSLRNLNMRNLVVLRLSYNFGLTDDWDGWRQLKMANNLKVLDLACRSLQTLPELSTKLVELYLSGCSSLKTIPNISSLKELKVFDAQDCKMLIQIGGLSGLISLEYLQLNGCNSLKEGLCDLSNLNNLQVVRSAPGVLDLTDFSNFKKLKQMDIYESNRFELQTLDGLEALEDLRIYHCPSIVRLPNLSYLKRLKTLYIWGCDQLIEIQNLSELKSLEKLSIDGCISIKALLDLSPPQQLKTLHFSYCESLTEIQTLDGLEALEDLKFSRCHSMVRLPKLSCLKRLKTLKILECEQLIEIQDLSELKSLETLSIKGCISVKALPDLSPLQKLKTLHLSYSDKLSEIRGLEELKCLEELCIPGCPGLRHLRDLSNARIQSALVNRTFEYSESDGYTTNEESED